MLFFYTLEVVRLMYGRFGFSDFFAFLKKVLKLVSTSGIMMSKLNERSRKMATKKTNAELFSAVLYLVIGLLLVIFRTQTLGWAMTIAGVVFVVAGVLDVVKKNMVGGAVSLIIGIAILVLGWLAAQIVLLVLGILIAIKGVVALLDALQKRKTTLLGVLFPVLTIIVGVMLAFGNGLDIMILIVGILLMVDGILGLLNAAKK
jgi:uncharacterized membrane protein HdeD (DUF308 family)